jgi:hypothetical protein
MSDDESIFYPRKHSAGNTADEDDETSFVPPGRSAGDTAGVGETLSNEETKEDEETKNPCNNLFGNSGLKNYT